MHKINIKNSAGRLFAFTAAVGLFAATGLTAFLPAATSADALNPLTERTLLLTSSAPGWEYLDGAGNTKYAPPGSGSNGKYSGETFSFKVSTNSTSSGINPTSTPVKSFTLQYCTTPAGVCAAPGNDVGSVGSRTDDSSHSDLNVNLGTPVDNTDFMIKVGGSTSSGWTMTTGNLEDASSGLTGKNNFVTFTNSTGISPNTGDMVQIYVGTGLVGDITSTIPTTPYNTYITNPGAAAFFVKINTYSDATVQNFRTDYPTASHAQTVMDGGVTVANVMAQSIEIQTKVLETMDFSVGTVDPDTVAAASLTGGDHGQCDSILPKAPGATTANNTITLGNTNSENSLSTVTPYDATSYWRLSSNSTNGATVYYSGPTLHDTENDQVAPLTDNPSSNASVFAHVGTEQFGLGINSNTDTLDSTFTTEVAAHTASDTPNYWHNPTLSPLIAEPSYGSANGTLANGSGPKFAFNSAANTIPVPIAAESTQVVSCATGKMRYVADIAATTPAGLYSTKINYLACPEY